MATAMSGATTRRDTRAIMSKVARSMATDRGRGDFKKNGHLGAMFRAIPSRTAHVSAGSQAAGMRKAAPSAERPYSLVRGWLRGSVTALPGCWCGKGSLGGLPRLIFILYETAVRAPTPLGSQAMLTHAADT